MMKPVPETAVSDYMTNGYVVLPELLGGDELETLRSSCDTLLSEPLETDIGGMTRDIGRGHDRRFLRHRHTDLPGLAAFILGPAMKELAANFVGEKPFLFNEQFVVKGAKTGASFAWHQDSGYVGFDHTPYVTMWIALDDTTRENGAVSLLPRNISRDRSIYEHRWDEDGKELVGYDGEDEGVAAVVAAGSVVVFSSVTLHRSAPNRTDRPRRGYVVQYSGAPIIDPKTARPKAFAKAL